MPVISCIMTAFNAAETVDEAVRSILDQSFEDFELLIVDDGSTDATLDKLERFQAKESRIRLWSLANHGQTRALNFCLGEVQGRYIARMDADDVSLPERFARQQEYLDVHPDIVALGTLRRTIDMDGRTLKAQKSKRPFAHDLLKVPPRYVGLVHPSAMIRTDALQQVGGYRPYFRYAQDVDLWMRLAEIGKLSVLPEHLLLYRQTEHAISSAKKVEQQLYAAVALASAVGRAMGIADDLPETGEPELSPLVEKLRPEAASPSDFEIWLLGRLARRLGTRALPPDVAAAAQEACGHELSDILNPSRFMSKRVLARSLKSR